MLPMRTVGFPSETGTRQADIALLSIVAHGVATTVGESVDSRKRVGRGVLRGRISRKS